MIKSDELREDLKLFEKDFKNITNEFKDIFFKFIDFSHKAESYINAMKVELKKLEEKERRKHE